MEDQQQGEDEWLGHGSNRWMLPTNNTGLERLAMDHMFVRMSAELDALAKAISSACLMVMSLVATYRLAQANTSFGVIINAFIVSFPVGSSS